MSDLLIAAVFNKSPIWDKRDKLHSNRNVVDKCWKEISAELKEDETKLRKKWKYLRDQFAVELGRIPPSRSGDAGSSTHCPKWPFFESLKFLKDVVRPRASSGNLNKFFVPSTSAPQSTASTSNSYTDCEDIAIEYPPASYSDTEQYDVEIIDPIMDNLPAPSSSSTPVSRKRRKPMNDYNQQIINIENKKLEFLKEKSQRRESRDKENQDDEHLYFFKSLLPHVREIPRARILSFRSRIQEVVEQFAYESLCASPPLFSITPNPEEDTSLTAAEVSQSILNFKC